MDYETYVKATLECNFSGYKEELIDSACKRICEYNGNKTRNEKLKEDYSIKLNQRQSYLVMINCLTILWYHACNKQYDGGHDMKKTLEFILDEFKKYDRLYKSELDKKEGNDEH